MKYLALRGLVLLVVVLLSMNSAKAQWEEESNIEFGIKMSGVFTLDYLNGTSFSATDQGVDFSFNPVFSTGIGCIIRFKLSDAFSFQTGISSQSRIFRMKINADSASLNRRFHVVSYQIPAVLLVKVQLAEKLFGGVNLGPAIEFFPADNQYYDDNFRVVAVRNRWVLPTLHTGFGFDFKTESKGTFHLGASYVRMLAFMSSLYMEYSPPLNGPYATNDVQGHYFSVDLAYFFK